MKTIVENSTKLSKYLLDDATPVEFLADIIRVGNPDNLDFIIADLNEGNATLIEGVVNAPEDWYGNKYMFDATRSASDQWSVNPDWVEFEEPEDE